MPSPSADRPLVTAVLGAGLSGLACARSLADSGWSVRVFDKARGAGGRMSTRRADGRHFDHGAQYFTVRDERFEGFVESWRQNGLVSEWDGEIAVLGDEAKRWKDRRTRRFVGVPGMNSICRHLAAGLDLTFETRVAGLDRVDGRWLLTSDGGAELGSYDSVVVSAPAPQTAALLKEPAPALAARAARVDMAPCWAVMASFPVPLRLGFDGAFVHDSALSWVARNNSKPGRPDGEAWLLHASPDWSRAHLELEKEDAAKLLLAAFRTAVGGLDQDAAEVDAHRWLYALPTNPLTEPYLYDADLGLGACGDWCGGPRVEGAFLSGCALADRLLGLVQGR